MKRRFTQAALAAVLALAVASAIAFASSAHPQPPLSIASLSTPSGHLRAGDSFRLRVAIDNTTATPVRRASVSYRAVRRIGRRTFVAWLGEDGLGRVSATRQLRYATKLRLPPSLSIGTYRLIACVWRSRVRKAAPTAVACRGSGKFKLEAAPSKPVPTPPPVSAAGPAPGPAPSPPAPSGPQDVTPPSLDVVLSPAAPDGSNGYYSKQPVVHASADDPDLARLTCTDNGATVLDLTTAGTHLEGDVPTSGDGGHHVSCSASDRAGDSANRSAAFAVDSALPAVGLTDPADGTVTASTSPSLDGPAGTASGDSASVTVAIYSGASSAGSPVRTLSAAVSSGNWHASPSPALADGIYTVQASQSNAAGNSARSASHTFTVDTTAPAVHVTLTPASPDGTNGWYKSPPAVNATADDPNLSGFSCSVDGSSVPATISGTHASSSPSVGDGSHTVACTATDAAGNTTSDSKTFKVDSIAPVVAVSLDPASPDGANGWYKTEPTVVASADDSNLASLSCSVDGGSATSEPVSGTHGGGAVTVTGDGSHSVACTATDAAGNAGSDSQSFKVSGTGPAVAVTLSPATANGSNGWYKSQPTVQASADDANLSSLSCSVDGSPVDEPVSSGHAGGTLTVTGDGSHTVSCTATNQAGQTASDSKTFKVDSTIPTAGISLTPSSASGSDGWYTSQPSVVASGDDTNLSSLSCSVDGGSATSEPVSGTHGGGSVTVTGDGSHTVSCTATDAAGNTKSASQTFKVDSTPPTASVTLSPSSPNGSNGWYKSQPSVAVAADDANLSSLSCTVDGGSPVDEAVSSGHAGGSLSVSGDGSHSMSCTATDAAGNTKSASQAYKVDTSAPSASVTLNPSSPNGSNGFYKTQPAVTAAADDSNLSSLSCSVDGGSATTEPVSGTHGGGSVTVTGDGSHTVSCTATDAAGNTKSASQAFKVDSAAPTASVTLAPSSPNGSNGWYKSQPTVQASADDANLTSLSCSVDGGGPISEAVSNGHAGGTLSVTGDGSHSVACTATDGAGNSTPASSSFKVDSVAPRVTFTDPNPGATTDNQTPTFAGGAGTASGDGSTVSVAVYKGSSASGSAVETSSATVTGGSWSLTSTRLDYGTYTAVVSQSDAAGNVGSAQITIDVPAVLDSAGDIASCNENGSNPLNWTVASGGSTATLLGTTNPDAIAPLGDNVYEDGTFNEYSYCYGPTWGTSSFLGITRPTPGNHEYTSLSNNGYFNYFKNVLSPLGSSAAASNQGWYSYDLGHWHIVVLNTSDGCGTVSCAAGSAQEKWLKADLAAHPNVCTLAYWHHPLYTSDNEAGVPPETAVRPLWQDLYNAHVDLVLNGHAHLYERFKPQDPNGNAVSGGITEITVGTGGYSEHTYASPAANSVVLADTYGILELSLGANSYSFQFLPAAGQRFTDNGSGNCHETG